MFTITCPKYVEKRPLVGMRLEGKHYLIGSCKIAVVGYWPVRMQLTTKGKFHFMFCHLVTERDGKIAQLF